MTFRIRTCLSLLVVLCLAAPLLAQRPGGDRGGDRGGRSRGGPGGFGGFGAFGGGGLGGFGGGNPLFVLGANGEELKLTDEQKEKLRELGEKQREDTRMFELFGKMRDASDEEREKLQAEIRNVQEDQRKTLDAKVREFLTPEQVTRYKQLAIQSRGVGSLSDSDIAGDLKLTPEQLSKLKEISTEYETRRNELRESMRNGGGGGFEEMRAKGEELRKQFEEKRLSVLTDEQRGQWKTMLGPEPATAGNAAGGGAPPSAGPSGTPNRFARRPSPTEDSAPATTTPIDTTQRMQVASFGKSADELLASRSGASEETQPAGEGTAAKAPTEEPKMSFSFQKAPWSDVLRMFAEVAGMTLDLNVVPPGTFNYLDDNEHSITEALDVINGHLLQRGYVLVRRDRALVVVNIDDGIPPNLIPNVNVEDLAQRGKNELMNVILPIDGITPEEAAEEAKELIGPQGSVTALKRASAISLTDIGSNLRRIHRLLTGINAAPTDLMFRSFDLEHIEALDAEVTVRRLLGLSVGIESVSDGVSRNRDRDYRSGDDRDRRYTTPTTTKSKAQVATDERTNRLLITASSAEMKIIEDTLKAIDVADDPSGGGTRRVRSREPYLEVYSVRTADPMEVAKTLNVLYPGCVVNEDGRARRLHIHGTPAQHEAISKMIRQLDGQGGGGTTVAVIPTGRIDALTAVATLQSLFATEKEAAPSIQPHPTGAGLIVRGSDDQVNQVRLLLSQLDPNALVGDGPKGNLRTVPLMGRDPEEFSRLLEQIWRSRHSNPIKIVPIESKPVRELSVPSAERETSAAPPRSSAAPVKTLNDSAPVSVKSKRIAPEPKRNANANDARPSAKANPPAPTSEPRANAKPISPAKSVRIVNASLQSVDDEQADEESEAPAPTKKKKNKANKKNKAQEPADDSAAKSQTDKIDQPATSGDSSETSASKQPAEAEGDPILVVPSGGNLVIRSNDEAALDDLEALIEHLQEAMPSRPTWNVFYLRSADAAETAAMLERLIPSSSVSSSVVSSGGMLGELTGGMSAMGRSLMNATGLSNVGVSHLTLRIVPEVRSNALYVSGPPDQVREVKLMLQVLDADETPAQLRDRSPHFIDLQHAEAEEVAAVIKEIYKDDMVPEGQQPGQQMNPFAMFMGGGSNRGGSSSRGGAGQQGRAIKLLITTEPRTNRLVVSASESLFRQIEALALELDDAARAANRTVRVVDLKGANSSAVQMALGAMNSKIKITSSNSRTRSSSSSSGSPPSGSSSGGPPTMGGFPGFMPPFGGGFGGPLGGSSPGGSSGGSSDDFRRMIEQRMRERFGGGGGDSGRPGR